MRLGVVTVSRLRIGLAMNIEPGWNAQPEAEGREFHQRNVKRATVERDQRGMPIRFPAAPKMFCDHVWTKFRIVQCYDVEQSEIGGDFGHNNGDGVLERVRNEVAVVLLHQLGPIPRDRVAGRQPGTRIANLRDELPIRDALDIEHEITNLRIACAQFAFPSDKELSTASIEAVRRHKCK